MYVLATNMWFSSLMRQFFFWIDKIVFNFISAIYNVLIAIARTSVFTQSDFAELSDRIYKLLAVFMVFKVTLSLITYVVNPDNFTEKSKGVYKLSTNIIISLAMLILTPYIFSYAYEVQTILLEDNSLGVLILGGDDNNANDSVFNTAGDKIAYTAMTPFFSPNVSLVSNCTTLLTGEAGNKVFNSKCSGITDGSTNEDGTLYGLTVDNEKHFSEQTLKTYVTGVEKGNLGLMFRQDMALATANDNTEFVMDYKFLFSTATGIIIILLLVTFCMDVGVRSIKLAFLQLIAPVPIISYIDPKKGKDGMFKKWGEMCFKTYLSLFIRLIALYFAVFIIEKISDGQLVDVVDGSYITNPIIYVFIIIGALMFAKQLPKILEGLGIKLDGDGKFSLNPLRKMENNMLGGKALKKSNDLLAKAGKGVLKAPISGAALLGKKTIGGIDAARNGKGFKQGWNRTHGKLHNNFYKKLDEWAPDSAEQRKNERLGREEVKAMNTKWTEGYKAAKIISNTLGTDKPFSKLDGMNIEAYNLVYKNEEFIKSRMRLDDKDEERKILQRISDMMMKGTELELAIKAESEAIGGRSVEFQNKLNGYVNEISNAMTEEDKKKARADQGAKFTKNLDDTTKAVSGMEKVHESIRKQNQKDAQMEDALKHVKYNPIDPTDPTNEERHSPYS